MHEKSRDWKEDALLKVIKPDEIPAEFMLEYFEGPQLLGLDIASDLSLNRCHSSPRIIDRQPVVCHIDCCRDIGTYVWRELALKYSAGIGVMMPLTSRFGGTAAPGR